MTKQNTKPEWEKEWAVKLTDLVFEAKRGDVVSTPKLLADLENLLASQRHQLKQQVLEAIGKDETTRTWHRFFKETPFQKSNSKHSIDIKCAYTNGYNFSKAEVRQRIEAVFDKEK